MHFRAELPRTVLETEPERVWVIPIHQEEIVPAVTLDIEHLDRLDRADALRHLPRHHDAHSGLYVFTGLGSRGLTQAALGAELLAAWITGAPCPVEVSLRDATDPARFSLRARQRAEN